MSGALSPSSGIICEIVNSVGQGNFTLVRKKSGNFKNLWLCQPCQSREQEPDLNNFYSVRGTLLSD